MRVKLNCMLWIEYSSLICIYTKNSNLVHVWKFGNHQYKNCKCVEEQHRVLIVSCMWSDQVPIERSKYLNISVNAPHRKGEIVLNKHERSFKTKNKFLEERKKRVHCVSVAETKQMANKSSPINNIRTKDSFIVTCEYNRRGQGPSPLPFYHLSFL